MEKIGKNYRYREDEIFKRLKVTTFAQLILQVASVSELNESANDCESHHPEDPEWEHLCEQTNRSPQMSARSGSEDTGDTKEICCTARSTLLSVISGVGKLNLDRNDQQTADELASNPQPCNSPYPECPYLLLDVRDRNQYDHCHIISAHSFPIAMLSRTMNPYTKEVLEYKNAAGKIIIVYDEDERIASQAATTMCEGGFENLFVLSGGLKVIAQKFPCGMTTGSIPTSCLSSPPSSRVKKFTAPQQPAERRWRFTSDELAKIQEQMEQIFIPSNSNSRLSSHVSSSSAHSSTSRRRSSSTSGRDSARVQSCRPWK
ncbi:centrosomal protein of 41 kDa-like [Pholidichthys leucotaenia]